MINKILDKRFVALFGFLAITYYCFEFETDEEPVAIAGDNFKSDSSSVVQNKFKQSDDHKNEVDSMQMVAGRKLELNTRSDSLARVPKEADRADFENIGVAIESVFSIYTRKEAYDPLRLITEVGSLGFELEQTNEGNAYVGFTTVITSTAPMGKISYFTAQFVVGDRDQANLERIYFEINGVSGIDNFVEEKIDDILSASNSYLDENHKKKGELLYRLETGDNLWVIKYDEYNYQEAPNGPAQIGNILIMLEPAVH